MSYGIQPTGYVRKPLSVILAELEASLVTEFGPGVIQTPQSPLGQLNGLMADIITELWELGEDIYQSYDPDQAEGTRLDTLARLRLIRRGDGEADNDFRSSITNAGVARITLADITRAVQNVPGVVFRQVFVNETAEVDSNFMPPNTVAVAVLGGDDAEVAAAINRYVTPGISTHGNTAVSTIEDGYCRTIRLIRPLEIETTLDVMVKLSAGRTGCPAPSPTALEIALWGYLTNGNTRPINGRDIDPYLTRSFLESNFEGVEFVNQTGYKTGVESQFVSTVPFEFFEIADVAEVIVTVV